MRQALILVVITAFAGAAAAQLRTIPKEAKHVRYLVDGAGMVVRVWILSPHEKAELPPPPFPK